MINLNKFLLISLFFSISGCVTNPGKEPVLNDVYYPDASQERTENWNNMVGTWYGSQRTKDGGTYNWIIKRNTQGLYRLEGKIVKPTGLTNTENEVGEWGVGKSIYFSIYKGKVIDGKVVPSNPADPYNRDIYTVLELTKDSFRYQHIDSGELFHLKKVANDFMMPTDF